MWLLTVALASRVAVGMGAGEALWIREGTEVFTGWQCSLSIFCGPDSALWDFRGPSHFILKATVPGTGHRDVDLCPGGRGTEAERVLRGG